MLAKDRFALVDAVFDVMETYDLKMIFVGIDKEAHHKKYTYPDPVEDVAYRFMLERFNYCVGRQSSLGLVVADEQKGSRCRPARPTRGTAGMAPASRRSIMSSRRPSSRLRIGRGRYK